MKSRSEIGIGWKKVGQDHVIQPSFHLFYLGLLEHSHWWEIFLPIFVEKKTSNKEREKVKKKWKIRPESD